MNLGEFIKFAKDFEINLQKTVVSSVFKRTALYSREMYFGNFKDAMTQLMKELNKVKLASLKAEFKDLNQAIKAAHGQLDQIAEENLKERLKKREAEYQRIRIANEDNEALYREMIDSHIHIEDPENYRSKIKGYKEAFMQEDMKERLKGLLKESEIIPKKNVQEAKAADNYTFKPQFYNNPYKGKVKSVIRAQLDISK